MAEARMNNRDTRLDGVKLVLIALVAFGHLVSYSGSSPSAGLVVASLIYTFHMPLFILISGHLSQTITWEKFKKSVWPTVETFLLFSLAFVALSEGSLKHLWGPTQSNWYLLSLLSWRLMYLVLQRYVPSKVGQILCACIGAFAVFNCFPTNTGLLSIQRTFQFFPFFVIGATMSRLPTWRYGKWASVLVVTVVVALTVAYVDGRWMQLHYHLYYVRFYMECFDLSWMATNLLWLGSLAVGFLLSLAVWRLVQLPARWAQYGRHSMAIFILQGVLTYGLKLVYTPTFLESVLVSIAIVALGIYLGEHGCTKWLSTPVTTLYRENRRTD